MNPYGLLISHSNHYTRMLICNKLIWSSFAGTCWSSRNQSDKMISVQYGRSTFVIPQSSKINEEQSVITIKVAGMQCFTFVCLLVGKMWNNRPLDQTPPSLGPDPSLWDQIPPSGTRSLPQGPDLSLWDKAPGSNMGLNRK